MKLEFIDGDVPGPDQINHPRIWLAGTVTYYRRYLSPSVVGAYGSSVLLSLARQAASHFLLSRIVVFVAVVVRSLLPLLSRAEKGKLRWLAAP